MDEKPVEKMSRYELDALQERIAFRRLVIAAEDVTKAGIPSTTFDWSAYVLVYSPLDEFSNVWATVDECRRLCDTLHNLSPEESFRRWYHKVENPIKVFNQPYTEEEARRDTLKARKELASEYNQGKITGSEYRELYQTTNFSDLVNG